MLLLYKFKFYLSFIFLSLLFICPVIVAMLLSSFFIPILIKALIITAGIVISLKISYFCKKYILLKDQDFYQKRLFKCYDILIKDNKFKELVFSLKNKNSEQLTVQQLKYEISNYNNDISNKNFISGYKFDNIIFDIPLVKKDSFFSGGKSHLMFFQVFQDGINITEELKTYNNYFYDLLFDLVCFKVNSIKEKEALNIEHN